MKNLKNLSLASDDKIRCILSSSQIFTVLNKLFLDRPSVAVISIVNNFLPPRTSISSDVIGRIPTNSFLASFSLKIIAAMISRIAKSIKFCNYSHVRRENCTSNCIP